MTSALALLCLAAMAGAAEPVALLTAYGPFAGRGVNGSETVARGLDGVVIAGTRIRILVLPVRWGEPERVLPAAVSDAHPVLLLGLGEGWPDAATVERQAVNRAEHADEADHPPPAALDPAGPAVRRATLRFDRAWFPADASLRASDDAGTYLCNSLLYVAAAQPVPRAGFMHLPPQGDTPVDEYRARWTPLVRTLIERNLPAGG